MIRTSTTTGIASKMLRSTYVIYTFWIKKETPGVFKKRAYRHKLLVLLIEAMSV